MDNTKQTKRVPAEAEEKQVRKETKPEGPDFFERSSSTTQSVGNVGSYLFDNEDEREKRLAEERLNSGAISNFAHSKALTPIDGLAKGFAAFGTGLGKGIAGVFTEPVKGASEGGAAGFFSGIGRGLVGLVARPTAGVLEFGVKTTEGFANTPATISGLMNGDNTEYKVFGVPLAVSLAYSKKLNQRHLLVKCFDELEHEGLDKACVFETPANEAFLQKIKESFDQGQDVNLEAIEPHVIVNLLKLYLLELVEPLVPYSIYPELLTIGLSSTVPGMEKKDTTDDMKLIKAHLSQIPEEHKAVLSELCLLLRKFIKSSSRNGLDMRTLCFYLSLFIMRPNTWNPQREAGGIFKTLTEAPQTKEISEPEKRAIMYITRLLIVNYQPGYLTYSLFGQI